MRSILCGGEYEESIAHLEKAKALAPEDKTILAELAKVKEEMRTHDAKVCATPDYGASLTWNVIPDRWGSTRLKVFGNRIFQRLR